MTALPPPTPADDTRNLPLLRIGAALQLLGAVPGLLIFLAFLWNEAVERRVYGRGTAEFAHAWFWAVAPLALALAPFVWARRRWALRASLLLSPFYALGPWGHLASLRQSLHGGEAFLLFAGGFGVLAAVVIGVLYRKGRDALLA